MRIAPFLLALVLLAPPAAQARHHSHDDDDITIGGIELSPPGRLSARHDLRDVRFSITTEDGDVTLLLTDTDVAFQLSEKSWGKAQRELRHAEKEGDDDEGTLGAWIRSVVVGSVRSLLDHSVECSIRDLSDVRSRDGRLEFVDRRGHRVFGRINVSGHDVRDGFEPADADAFAKAFRKAKAAQR